MQSIVIDSSVCVSVCLFLRMFVRDHISGTARSIFTKFCVRIPCESGSVLLRRRCAALCTSGFMDDVTFGRNGRDAERWRLHSATAMNGVAIPGRSLMSMNAFYIHFQLTFNARSSVIMCNGIERITGTRGLNSTLKLE